MRGQTEEQFGEAQKLLQQKDATHCSEHKASKYNLDEDTNQGTCCTSSLDQPGTNSSWKSMLIGYAFLTTVICSYTTALNSLQLITQKTSIMELNVLRYSTEAFIILVMSLLTRHSLRLNYKVLPYVLVIATGEIFYCSCFFFAAAFMPAGNIEAFFTAFFIVFTTVVDLIQKVISKLSISTMAISCLGLIFLLQPWKEELGQILLVAPCDYFDGNIESYSSELVAYNITNNCSDYQHSSVESGAAVTQSIGYLLAACGAIGSAIAGYTFKRALLTSEVEALLFWTFFTETSVSLLLSVVWNSYHDYGYGLPPGTYCLLFTLLFTTTSALGCVLSFTTYRYIAVSAFALGWPLVTVLLYVSQRTFLSRYHPGQSNATEVAGIVCINIGAILSAVINILYQTKRLTF